MCQKEKNKNCIHCSESFEAKRKNHRYCSASCRVMACYKRKGYTYVSGHYKKPQSTSIGEVPDHKGMTGVPVPQNASRGAQVSKPESPGRSADKPSVMGIAENAIGSGLVSTAKYLMHDKSMMEMIRELHEVLVAQPRRILQQQTKGMGMQPMPFPSSPSSQPLNRVCP
jgi:hypothetical protein